MNAVLFARTFSAFQFGFEGQILKVEAAPQPAPPQIHITGLPTEVIKESRERIRVALGQLGFDVPSQKVVVHLAPANQKKEGSQFDLALALCVLGAEGRIAAEALRNVAFLGELGMDGALNRVRNIVPLLLALRKNSAIEKIIIPAANGPEANLMGCDRIFTAKHLGEVIEWLHGRLALERPAGSLVVEQGQEGPSPERPSIDEVMGQALAKRVLTIALAGRHHLLWIGQPGVGKTMLSQAAARLTPPLSKDELLELSAVQTSICDNWTPTLNRPFRSPHHTISLQGFVGGGTGRIIPGEVSLAHHGILFLDELPEFRKDVIEALREPLQTSEVHVHRLAHSFRLPARFTLIAAMNPCPCGLMFSREKRCICPREQVLSYRKRISGAILDRIDLGLVLTPPDLNAARSNEDEEALKKKIGDVWRLQQARPGGEGAIPPFLLNRARMVSTRTLRKMVRVARTIADLDGASQVEEKHYEEAWALRCPDIHSFSLH